MTALTGGKMTRKKLILDVDTGTDDAVAIMFAALHPALELVACTTVNGNVPVEHSTDNTLRVLDSSAAATSPSTTACRARSCARDFPMPRDDARPAREDPRPELPMPPPTRARRTTGAVEFLVETYRVATDEITLVPVGPLSNIAAALALDPRLVDAVQEVVIMGGGHEIGNVTPSAEFNIWADPEAAADGVRRGFRKLTLVPLDATHRALVSRADCDGLALGTPAGEASPVHRRRIGAYSSAAVVAAAARCTTRSAAPRFDPT